MQGFEQAQREYERKLFDPFGDEEDEEGMTREEYEEMQADMMLEEILLKEHEK